MRRSCRLSIGRPRSERRRGQSHRTALFVLFAGLPLLLVTPARADLAPVPAADYPPTTQLQYFPNWSNRDFDCNFGLNCEQVPAGPVMHVWTEDQMQRLAGWAMWGMWHDDAMGFELYSSTYAPGSAPYSMTWNQFAAHDERLAIEALQKAKNAPTVPNLVPCGFRGSSFAEDIDQSHWHLYFLTVWWGTGYEIEAAALYPVKRKAEARNYLVAQVRVAVQQAIEAATPARVPGSGFRHAIITFCASPDLTPSKPG